MSVMKTENVIFVIIKLYDLFITYLFQRIQFYIYLIMNFIIK
jgi:hypothetical protein